MIGKSSHATDRPEANAALGWAATHVCSRAARSGRRVRAPVLPARAWDAGLNALREAAFATTPPACSSVKQMNRAAAERLMNSFAARRAELSTHQATKYARKQAF
jgi:hypothetical protein